MILDRHFDRVFVISLPGREERLARALSELKERGLSDQARPQVAVDGRIMKHPAWWRAGAGAWGCLMSHCHLMQKMHLDGYDSMLVLEDDAIWLPDAAALFEDFIRDVPADWGQIYLGGVHRATPEQVTPRVYRGMSVNRTHAYAVHAQHVAEVHQHVLHAPDYISSGQKPSHIDHQLEKAHQRKAWPVYTPSWWLAGQGSNKSDINGRTHPDKWWQWITHPKGKFPVALFNREATPEELAFVHFGFASDPATCFDPAVKDAVEDPLATLKALDTIAGEAIAMQKIPAMRVVDGVHKQRMELVLGSRARDADTADLRQLADYPRNGLFYHPWLNPVRPV